MTVNRGKRGGGVCVLEFASGAIGNFHMADSGQPLEHYGFFGNSCHVAIDGGLRVAFQRNILPQFGSTTTYAPEGLDSGAIV